MYIFGAQVARQHVKKKQRLRVWDLGVCGDVWGLGFKGFRVQG